MSTLRGADPPPCPGCDHALIKAGHGPDASPRQRAPGRTNHRFVLSDRLLANNRDRSVITKTSQFNQHDYPCRDPSCHGACACSDWNRSTHCAATREGEWRRTATSCAARRIAGKASLDNSAYIPRARSSLSL